MWLACVLLCRDIELAGDEKVIGELDNEQRADYTKALVACSVNRRIIAACPLAFGEIVVKERVKMVMKYRKPTFWVVFLSVVICMVAAVCFLINPLKDNKGKDAAVDHNIENTDTEIAKEEENISEKMVSDIAYYLELSASGKEFRDADESDTNRIMSEYVQLLDGYSLIARESMKCGIEFVQCNISLSFTRK